MQRIEGILVSLNVLRWFITNISYVTKPPRGKSMSRMKELLNKVQVLQYFDVDKKTTLQSDASKSKTRSYAIA